MITLVFHKESENTTLAYETSMVNFFDQNFLIFNVKGFDQLGSFNNQLVKGLASDVSDLSSFISIAMQLNLTLYGVRSDNRVIYVKNGTNVNFAASIEPIKTGNVVLQSEEHFTGLFTGSEVTLSKYPVSNYHIQIYRNGKLQMPVQEYLLQGDRIVFIRPFGYGQHQTEGDESVSVFYTVSIAL